MLNSILIPKYFFFFFRTAMRHICFAFNDIQIDVSFCIMRVLYSCKDLSYKSEFVQLDDQFANHYYKKDN